MCKNRKIALLIIAIEVCKNVNQYNFIPLSWRHFETLNQGRHLEPEVMDLTSLGYFRFVSYLKDTISDRRIRGVNPVNDRKMALMIAERILFLFFNKLALLMRLN